MAEEKISILIVEDDESARISLKAILSIEGYAVKDADSGKNALALVKEKSFDFFLVDYRLPDVNGIEVIRQLLAVQKEAIPVIITGAASLDTAVEAMRIGVHDYLAKPVNIEELKKLLDQAVLERDEFRKGKAKFQDVIHRLKKSDDHPVQVILARNPAEFPDKDTGMRAFFAKLFKPGAGQKPLRK